MLKNKVILIMVIIAGMLLAACAAPGQPGSNQQATPLPALLENQEWTLTSLLGQEPLPGTDASVQFEDGTVTGTTGCNSFGGEFMLSDNSLTFNNLYQTEMACTEPAGIMQQETAFMQAMMQTASYQITGNQLEIQNSDGETLLVFTR
jgi:heat shock protein HslJ